ncbi:glycosyltransferase [Aurantimonas sp. Leaf443]|uniref:glycosyltransferase n=1 Tax=Aurantimonas sp. Leaf443 TaxID=1736378 RepID=UPI0006F1EB74|nr:glycosyltransferase [Aurantimonas sp. Leaf443]KQT85085.1 glycosyl transferase [Aurantimonas sp. Leaf443]
MTRIVVFGFDAAESSQIRRISSFQGAGYDVVAFTMRRDNMGADFVPTWRNIHLFKVANERIVRRLAVLFLSIFKIAWHRSAFRGADVIVARNFDMLMLAFVGRLVALKPRLPIVYECLDIHGSFTAQSRAGALFRRIERFMLDRIALLVVSSPGFVRNYFEPVQRYHGPVYLMENKIWFGDTHPARRSSAANVSGGDPWVLGWVGSLRCEPSLRILLRAAERLGNRVRIEMHGNVHHHVLPDFEARIAAYPNIVYRGPYTYPHGLAAVYSACDFVWAQDLWQAGANSDWLLPNRIYEASYFGCLSIAVAGMETGRKVAAEELGYTIATPDGDALVALLDALDPAEVERRRQALLERDPAAFVSSSGDIYRMIEQVVA